MSDRQEVVKFLRGLTDKQLTEVFYEATQARPSDSRVVLAHAHGFVDEPWEVSLIGLNADEAPWADDVPLCQEGACSRCDSRVISWAKRMKCPVCGNEISGT